MDEWLSQQFGRLPIIAIMRKLRKGRRAVEHRAGYLGVTKRSDEYGYTIEAIVQALGTNHRCVMRWIQSGQLPATRRNTEHPRDTWLIMPGALRRFLLAHPEEVDLSRVQECGGKFLLFDLLASPGFGAGEFGRRDDEREGARRPRPAKDDSGIDEIEVGDLDVRLDPEDVAASGTSEDDW